MPKQKVQVKIKAESFIVKNTIHTTADGRWSNYTASQKDKLYLQPMQECILCKMAEILDEKKNKRSHFYKLREKIEMIEYL